MVSLRLVYEDSMNMTLKAKASEGFFFFFFGGGGSVLICMTKTFNLQSIINVEKQ